MTLPAPSRDAARTNWRAGLPELGQRAVAEETALAIRMADAAGITFDGVARADGFEVFTHPERIGPE